MDPNFSFIENFSDKRYVKQLKDALSTIIDLASDNLLDEHDAYSPELKKEARSQQKDMEVVQTFWSIL